MGGAALSCAQEMLEKELAKISVMIVSRRNLRFIRHSLNHATSHHDLSTSIFTVKALKYRLTVLRVQFRQGSGRRKQRNHFDVTTPAAWPPIAAPVHPRNRHTPAFARRCRSRQSTPPIRRSIRAAGNGGRAFRITLCGARFRSPPQKPPDEFA